MFFYSLFTFVVMGILIAIFIINANETNKGIFTWSRDKYASNKKGFDENYTFLFLVMFLFSPIVFPALMFALGSYEIGIKLYNKFIKEKTDV